MAWRNLEWKQLGDREYWYSTALCSFDKAAYRVEKETEGYVA